jgi:DNA-binding beta-propeller fold protein YncE/mono/diheme cytochrome c family protein
MKFKPLASLLYSTLLAAAVSACSNSQLAEPRFATGSQIMVSSSSYQALYVANADQGTIGRVPLAGGSIEQTSVGKLPTRLARARDKVFVTLRGERKVAILAEKGDKLSLETTIDVGAEPYGIVASEDGSRVYVTVSLENKVLELDGKSGTILRSFAVPNQPRWIALHPTAKTVYVASAFGGILTSIDVESGAVNPISTQTVQTFNKSPNGIGGQIPLSTRLTGDLAVSPQGDSLFVPAFLVDNVSEAPDDTKTDGGDVPFNPGGGYDAGRFNPVVIEVPLDTAGGKPDPLPEHNVVIQVNGFSDVPKVSYPTSVTVDPTGEFAVVTMEGAAGGVTFKIHPDTSNNQPGVLAGEAAAPAPDSRIGFPGGGGASFAFRNLVGFNSSAGPRGAVFTAEKQAFVYSFIDQKVGVLELAAIEKQLTPQSVNPGDPIFPQATKDIAIGGGGAAFQATPFAVAEEIKVADDVLSDVEQQGRRLFFAANDNRMSSQGSGVSCSGCHLDGRNDGLTWNFARGPRQTPSLAGKISLQAPVRWEGDSPTVAEDAFRTSQGLMGGQGLAQDDANAIETFLDSRPEVDVPLRGSSDPAVARGKEIFEREDVGCVSCHAGDRLTNKQKYEMFGLTAVQTRPLVGVAASAPYLHDGSAATLREVVKRGEAMLAKTAQLSEAEVDDLVKYLESL